jgi:hypothetical protein
MAGAESYKQRQKRKVRSKKRKRKLIEILHQKRMSRNRKFMVNLRRKLILIVMI